MTSKTKENSIKTAALYIRVSTHDQEELSPDSQKRLLLDYAKEHTMLTSEEYIYVEGGISGRKADKRPKFQQMIATAKRPDHPFDVILLWKFSRFARNQEESIVYKSMLRNKYNVDVISISEPLIDGPFGNLIERIIEWMDEFYSIRLSGDVTRGMTEKALRGGYQCRPPLGYKIPYHNAIPEIVPDEAKIVQIIFEKYVNDKMSLFALTKYLNSLGYKTSHGKPFEKRSLEYILQNPGYAGDIRWNRTVNETNEIRDPSEWIVRPGHHPAIISRELFEQAQIRYSSEYQRRNAKPSETSKHWLSGLLKCPSCGRSLSSCVRHRKNLPDTFSFQCYGYLKGKCSHNSYVRAEDIVPVVLKALDEVIMAGNVEYSIRISQASVQTSNEMDSLKKSLNRIALKEERAKDAYIEGIDSKEEYRATKEKLLQERKELEAIIADMEDNDLTPTSADTTMIGNIKNVHDMILSDELSMAQKNMAMKSIVDKIIFYRNQRHIEIYYFLTSNPRKP